MPISSTGTSTGPRRGIPQRPEPEVAPLDAQVVCKGPASALSAPAPKPDLPPVLDTDPFCHRALCPCAPDPMLLEANITWCVSVVQATLQEFEAFQIELPAPLEASWPAVLPVDEPSLGQLVEGFVEESVPVTPAKVAVPVADSEDLHHSPPGFSRTVAPDEVTDESRLSAFVKAVQCKIQTPLMPKPVKTKRVAPTLAVGELPKRSERLANHPLASVASSKRAEALLMHRFEGAPEAAPVTTEAKQAYKKFYVEGAREKNFEAIRDLLPSLRCASLLA
ncbi:unnamed protein product [Urochloa humidicola]